jgi:hypothetical protein
VARSEHAVAILTDSTSSACMLPGVHNSSSHMCSDFSTTNLVERETLRLFLFK